MRACVRVRVREWLSEGLNLWFKSNLIQPIPSISLAIKVHVTQAQPKPDSFTFLLLLTRPPSRAECSVSVSLFLRFSFSFPFFFLFGSILTLLFCPAFDGSLWFRVLCCPLGLPLSCLCSCAFRLKRSASFPFLPEPLAAPLEDDAALHLLFLNSRITSHQRSRHSADIVHQFFRTITSSLAITFSVIASTR